MKHRDIEYELIRAEWLLDSINQHLKAKHKEVQCVSKQFDMALGCVISVRNQVRNKSGLKQWTLTHGAFDHLNWRKTPKTKLYDGGGYLARFDPPKRKWSCQK